MGFVFPAIDYVGQYLHHKCKPYPRDFNGFCIYRAGQ